MTAIPKANPAIRVDVCAPGVPCGTYSTTTFGRAGVRVTPVSQEQDVKSVLTKVGLGEADAGIVYRTDAITSKDVHTIEIPARLNVEAAYPIAVLLRTAEPALAAQFVALVRSPAAREELARHGFSP